ncbi:hypothetical protein SAMN00120144_2940 [Hymenobacter roseosalivarius DSM 11622]|uniref:Uncharacterized protein n=1 Tax=Hymenobacter roseosalivarius DSM 11622 TaxID=645990 RepID=A0A1W1VUA8_9BACT|nr:hypothetical protein SAMN00120144_2940 [Hymenobacter roseosalivarius DSM 11622]
MRKRLKKLNSNSSIDDLFLMRYTSTRLAAKKPPRFVLGDFYNIVLSCLLNFTHYWSITTPQPIWAPEFPEGCET